MKLNKIFTEAGDSSARPKDALHYISDSKPVLIIFLALLVGVIASFAAVFFFKALYFLRRLIYFSSTSSLPEIIETIPWIQLLITFIVISILIGLFTQYVIHRPQGISDLIDSHNRETVILPRHALGGAVASLFSLALGASVGRESPAIHFATALSSWIAKLFKLKGQYFKILILSGVSSALATSFISPVAGVFFALEVISYGLRLFDLIPVAVASAAGTLISRHYFETYPELSISLQDLGTSSTFLYFIAIGLICGFIAIFFLKVFSYTASAIENHPLPKWVWLAIASIALSLIALAYPEVLGIGYETIDALLEAPAPITFLILLLVAKAIAIIISLTFGYSGGLFTPSIFMGLLIGAIMGLLLPDSLMDYRSFAIGGIVAFTGAILGAPITLTTIIFEFTHDFALTLNVFIAAICAHIVMKRFHVKSFFQWQYSYIFER